MIKVQDWVASIPDGDKHVAYVGEGMSETREFFLCGEGWETYRNWNFHLDMAFDPESITTRESRQVVQTQSHSSQMKEEAAVNTEESVTKESYTVEHEEVLDYNLTDIAPLEKHVEEDGIRLVWTVLRQHTVLPGKLWATLRAVDSTAQMVKKSAIMVFEVDAAICAVPAVRPAISEMEQIEARVADAADLVTYGADRAEAAVTKSLENVYLCQLHSTESKEARDEAKEYATWASDMYQSAVNQAATAEEHKWAALGAAGQAQEQATKAEKHYGQASDCADRASAASDTAIQAAASAALSAEGAANAVNKCSHYVVQCGDYAYQATQATQAMANEVYHRINVRDYGAVGDGVTDDRAAILAAFDTAKTMLPCEVYFPAGTYGISNGILVTLPCGSGGLVIRGAGSGLSVLSCLDSFVLSDTTVWEALRVVSDATPANENAFLQDISIVGMATQDAKPLIHQRGSHSTGGILIQNARRATVVDCLVKKAGDTAISLQNCSQAMMQRVRVNDACSVHTSLPAVMVSGTHCIVSDCYLKNYGATSIRETGERNLITGIIATGQIASQGTASVAANNITA